MIPQLKGVPLKNIEINNDRPNPLWGPFLRPGTKTFLFGTHKSGKTYFSLNLCISIAAGKPFLSYPVDRATTVVYTDFELSGEEMKERTYLIIDEMEVEGEDQREEIRTAVNNNFYYYGFSDKEFFGSQGELSENGKKLFEYAREINAELVVIDGWQYAIRMKMKDDFLWNVYKQLNKQLNKELDTFALLIIHHADKKSAKYDGSFGSYSMKGLSSQGDWADTVMILDKSSDKSKERQKTLRFVSRYADEPDLELYFDHPCFKLASESNKVEEAKKLMIKILLNHNKRCDRSELLRAVKDKIGSDWVFKKALSDLEKNGEVTVEQKENAKGNKKEVFYIGEERLLNVVGQK